VNVFKLFEIFQALAPMYIVHILQNDSIQRLHKNLKGIILFSKTQFFKYRFGVFDILPSIIGNIIIPVTRRVKGYTRFLEKYVSGRRKRFRPHKVYIFSIRITSRVVLTMSVCLSVRMNAEISETIRARLLTQRKFVSASCYAHSNAHKPPKTAAPTVWLLE